MAATAWAGRMSVDIASLKAQLDLVEVVSRYVPLKRAGKEYEACCPFHDERTPSFTVIPAKGFFHCFGCGAHGDAIGFYQRITGADFLQAVRDLGGASFADAREIERKPVVIDPEGRWVPLMPVPEEAPALLNSDGSGWTVPIFNPKRSRMTRLKPCRVDAYLSPDGLLLGYVLRAEIPDRESGKVRKWTPTVTWCIGPRGNRQWCLQHFPDPRPLLGLDALLAKPGAPVLVVEGEKCRAAGAGAWPQYAVVSWPGGSNGLAKVDWSPLAVRDVVLWPDADAAGRKAMLGWSNDAGMFTPGIAQYAHRVGARSLRVIDVAGQPRGWDIADALDPEKDGWTPAQLAGWASTRAMNVNVRRG